MRRHTLAVALAMALAGGCSSPAPEGVAESKDASTQAEPTTSTAAANPLDAAYGGEFAAVPFDQLTPEHFPPAFDRVMREQLAAVRGIADSAEAPTVGNTLEALERSTRPLTRVGAAFGALAASMASEEIQAIQRDYAGKLAKHQSDILLDPALFQRVRTLHESAEELGLVGEQKRLAQRWLTRFERAGAALDDGTRAEVAALTQKEAELMTRFGQNVLKDTEAYVMVIEEADLDGLPQGVRDGAATTAAARGQPGKYAFTLQRPSVEDFLTHSTRRDLREQLYRAFNARGENGNAFDNTTLIAELVELRAKRAKLLGYPSHAAYVTADSMIGSPEAALALLKKVWKPALAQATREREALQALAREMGAEHPIEGWDWRFYAEKLRQQQYRLDPAELQPYLSLDNMMAAAFHVTERLFGLRFVERSDIPVYHPDVRVFAVSDAAGKHVGLFYADYFARPGKRSGAWMSSLRPQETLDGAVTAHVVNNLNLTKPADGQPATISITEAETLFHELGHGLHGLLSQVTYPTLSGTLVPRDYVEFPAQFLEHYVLQPEVLNQFALHAETRQPMPADLQQRFIAASKFNQGFATVEFLASALVDQMYHALTPEQAAGIDPKAFERDALAQLGALPQIPMRHRSAHFSHIFAGGYSAGYYAYLWSEVLDSDGFAAFRETGNIFDPAAAARLREFVYSKGDTLDWNEAYRAFRGKDASTAPLLQQRGLASDD